MRTNELHREMRWEL